jgi:pimeloyl-ACP methyl ester carboxylesterase
VPYRETIDVEVWDHQVRTKVMIGGEGPPLLYLHAILGLTWDPFLDSLAEHHTVYAPYLPGTAPGEPDAHKPIEGLSDLMLVYDEIATELGLEAPAVVGHSLGGMFAAEYAATFPKQVSRLVLICPAGLWSEGRVWANPFTNSLEELAPLVFADPTGPVAQAALAMPTDPEQLGEAIIAISWAMGVSGKFWWPIPDRGLSNRIHRISAPTLVVWGEADMLIDPAYAADFERLIPNAKAEVLCNAAHLPQLERLDVVGPMVQKFLA